MERYRLLRQGVEALTVGEDRCSDRVIALRTVLEDMDEEAAELNASKDRSIDPKQWNDLMCRFKQKLEESVQGEAGFKRWRTLRTKLKKEILDLGREHPHSSMIANVVVSTNESVRSMYRDAAPHAVDPEKWEKILQSVQSRLDEIDSNRYIGAGEHAWLELRDRLAKESSSLGDDSDRAQGLKGIIQFGDENMMILVEEKKKKGVKLEDWVPLQLKIRKMLKMQAIKDRGKEEKEEEEKPVVAAVVVSKEERLKATEHEAGVQQWNMIKTKLVQQQQDCLQSPDLGERAQCFVESIRSTEKAIEEKLNGSDDRRLSATQWRLLLEEETQALKSKLLREKARRLQRLEEEEERRKEEEEERRKEEEQKRIRMEYEARQREKEEREREKQQQLLKMQQMHQHGRQLWLDMKDRLSDEIADSLVATALLPRAQILTEVIEKTEKEIEEACSKSDNKILAYEEWKDIVHRAKERTQQAVRNSKVSSSLDARLKKQAAKEERMRLEAEEKKKMETDAEYREMVMKQRAAAIEMDALFDLVSNSLQLDDKGVANDYGNGKEEIKKVKEDQEDDDDAAGVFAGGNRSVDSVIVHEELVTPKEEEKIEEIEEKIEQIEEKIEQIEEKIEQIEEKIEEKIEDDKIEQEKIEQELPPLPPQTTTATISRASSTISRASSTSSTTATIPKTRDEVQRIYDKKLQEISMTRTLVYSRDPKLAAKHKKVQTPDINKIKIASAQDAAFWNDSSLFEVCNFCVFCHDGSYLFANFGLAPIPLQGRKLSLTVKHYDTDGTCTTLLAVHDSSVLSYSDDKVNAVMPGSHIRCSKDGRSIDVKMTFEDNDGVLDLHLTRDGDGFVIDDGKVRFGKKIFQYFCMTMIRSIATGSLKWTVGKETKQHQITGYAFNTRNCSNFTPKSMPSTVYHCKLFCKDTTLHLMVIYGSAKYGKMPFSIGSCVHNGKLIMVTCTCQVNCIDGPVDPETGHAIPSRIEFEWIGKTFDGEIFMASVHSEPKKLLDRIDVLQTLPAPLRFIISKIVARPYFYQWYEPNKAILQIGTEELKLDGMGLIEKHFINV